MSFFYLLLIFYFGFIFAEIKDIFEGVYQIDSLKGYTLTASILANKLIFKRTNIKGHYFKFISVNSEQYYIESVTANKRLSTDNYNVLLLDKNKIDIKERSIWNIIKIKNNEFLIQNNATKRLFKSFFMQCKLSETLEEISSKNTSEIDNSYKFSFLKLYEEVKLKPEHLAFISNEPVDVVIKYIDLSDKTLNREGIKQINKDEDNEELRYSVRSILKYIPWIRKIFIVMPNEKVKYFKAKEEIKDKIVYIKDKDLIGFESANSFVFQFFLWNLRKFGVSDNFILMDDDYFIGKPINKSQFFYYDEDLKKVVPCIVSDDFRVLKRNEVLSEYNLLFSKKDKIDPHTADGWRLHTAAVFKFFSQHYNQTLISGGFTHNALSLNIDDIKEVFDLIKNKYEYANENLYSKTRNVFNLQSQTMFNTYSLNIKKRKVNMIRRKFIDLKDLPKYKNLDIDLFVINKSGENKYEDKQYLYEKKVLNLKYNESTKYEIPFDGNITSENEKIIENINETNLTNITEIILGKDNNILNKTIKSEIIQEFKNKSYIKMNLSIYENNEIFEKRSTKKSHNNLFFNLLIIFILLIIVIWIILFKDLFSDNFKRKLRIDNEEKHALKERKKIIRKKYLYFSKSNI